MSDLPERLRKADYDTPYVWDLTAEAADELEAQTALIAELVEAIEGLTSEKMNGPDSYELWHKATSALSKAKLATAQADNERTLN